MKSGAGNRILVVDRLNYYVDGTHILKEISLNADRGEFIGLIGPNGAGKTTLLKCINGIYKGGGCVEIDGMDAKRMSRRQTAAKVAMLHQNTEITFPFTAIDIVMTGRYHLLGRFKAESAGDYSAVRMYMEYTGTLGLEKRPINTLSGGERQRVLFAKVLAQETDLILLDEPSSNLDIANVEHVFACAAELCANGKTVIAAVHDLKTAARFFKRLVLMKDGRIIADGTPETVITRENLRNAYGVNALVYKNRITGLVDFHMPGRKDSKGRNIKVHVIGGGGSASGIVRHLFEKGYDITAGVFAHGDSDLNCVDVFGIKALVCRPFSEIDNNTHAENIELVKASDITILCDMPFGMQNIRNLEAAAYASRLVIIEDKDTADRDFTGGKALAEYNRLKEHATVIESARLHEVLP
ncbi:MAG: ABC transporter ATP-binding protein [Bacillota bacterium]